jgi:hypothetical protein
VVRPRPLCSATALLGRTNCGSAAIGGSASACSPEQKRSLDLPGLRMMRILVTGMSELQASWLIDEQRLRGCGSSQLTAMTRGRVVSWIHRKCGGSYRDRIRCRRA